MKKEERWKNQRRKYITASDAAAALGLHPRYSALDVYMDKRGLVDREECEAMRWGRRLEDPIARGYGEESGREVVKIRSFELVPHPDIPWLASTLDRLQRVPEGCPNPAPVDSDEEAILEIKDASLFWKDEAPLPVQIQVQIQLACTERSWGTAAELYRGIACRWQDIVRDDKFLETAIEQLEKFWWHVTNGIPPEPTQASDWKAVRKLYALPEDTSSEPVELPEIAEQIEADMEAAKERENASKAEYETAKAKLVALLGNGTYGTTPKGGVLIRKDSKIKEATRIVKAHTRVNLSWHPKA